MKKLTISDYAADAPAVLRDFLIYMTTIKGKSQQTAHEYFFDLRMFFRYTLYSRGLVSKDIPFEQIPIQQIDNNFLKTITISDAYEFLEYIAELRPIRQNSPSTDYGLSSTSRARKVATLRTFFKYLTHKTKILEVNPMELLDSPSQPKRLPKYLTLDDSINLLESVEGAYASRDYCILTLFLNCGMRISELANMNLQDIQGDSLRIIGKGNKERVIYLNDACKQAIENYLPERITPHDADKNAFFTSRNRNRLSVPTIKLLVKKHIAAAGLDTTQYSTHKLRHTAATLMYQNGVDIRTLQAVLGHSNLDTTKIYTHVVTDDIKHAMINNPLSTVRRTSKKSENTDNNSTDD